LGTLKHRPPAGRIGIHQSARPTHPAVGVSGNEEGIRDSPAVVVAARGSNVRVVNKAAVL